MAMFVRIAKDEKGRRMEVERKDGSEWRMVVYSSEECRPHAAGRAAADIGQQQRRDVHQCGSDMCTRVALCNTRIPNARVSIQFFLDVIRWTRVDWTW